MKSESRGLVISLMVFFLWGTIITGPFRYFAYAFRDFFLWIFNHAGAPSIAISFLVPILMVASMLFLLVLGTKKYASYTAGICALLSLLYYLFHCVLQSSFDSVSFVVVIGLALALVFIIFRVDKGSLWLSDAYVFSLPVLLFFELVLAPFFGIFPHLQTAVSGLWTIPSDSLGFRFEDFLGLPALLWGFLLFAVLLIPVCFLAKGRKKG